MLKWCWGFQHCSCFTFMETIRVQIRVHSLCKSKDEDQACEDIFRLLQCLPGADVLMETSTTLLQLLGILLYPSGLKPASARQSSTLHVKWAEMSSTPDSLLLCCQSRGQNCHWEYSEPAVNTVSNHSPPSVTIVLLQITAYSHSRLKSIKESWWITFVFVCILVAIWGQRVVI